MCVTCITQEGLDGVTSKPKPGCLIAIQKQDQYVHLKFIPIRHLAKNSPRDVSPLKLYDACAYEASCCV